MFSNFFSTAGGRSPLREIGVDKLAQFTGKARLIDVRESYEFHGDLGHIAGAQLVPLATLASVASAWDKEDTYVLICRSGNRSAAAAMMMQQMGFTDVINLRGGMLDYRSAGVEETFHLSVQTSQA